MEINWGMKIPKKWEWYVCTRIGEIKRRNYVLDNAHIRWILCYNINIDRKRNRNRSKAVLETRSDVVLDKIWEWSNDDNTNTIMIITVKIVIMMIIIIIIMIIIIVIITLIISIINNNEFCRNFNTITYF